MTFSKDIDDEELTGDEPQVLQPELIEEVERDEPLSTEFGKTLTEEEETTQQVSDLQAVLKKLTPKFKNKRLDEFMQPAMKSRIFPDNYYDKHNLITTALIEESTIDLNPEKVETSDISNTPKLDNLTNITIILIKISKYLIRYNRKLSEYLTKQIEKLKDDTLGDSRIAIVGLCSNSILAYADYCQNNSQYIETFNAEVMCQWLCAIDEKIMKLLGCNYEQRILLEDKGVDVDVVSFISMAQDGLSIGFEGRGRLEDLEIAGVAHDEEMEKLSKELGM